MNAPHSRETSAAFTILEVMIAMAILAVSLTAIFSAEGGAVAMSGRAHRLTTATLLARCKMAELEEKAFKDGITMGATENGNDTCCEGDETEGFRCDWSIASVNVPEMGDEENDATKMLGAAAEKAGLGGAVKNGTGGSNPSQFDPMALASGGPEQMLAGAGGGTDFIGQMAMNIAFPVLKETFAKQVRRADVKVIWKEGEQEQTMDLMQFLVVEPTQPSIINRGGAH